MELRICESLFRRQSEVTRQVVEGISHTHVCSKVDLPCVIYAVIQDASRSSSYIVVLLVFDNTSQSKASCSDRNMIVFERFGLHAHRDRSEMQTNHMQILSDFVEAQASYFDQCNQHAQELQKHLARCVRPAGPMQKDIRFPRYRPGSFKLQMIG